MGDAAKPHQRLLGLLDDHWQRHKFLLGNRPGSGDYAIYGQLTQLIGVDPTPAAQALVRSRRTCAWVDVMEDLSGLEPQSNDWIAADSIPPTLIAILSELGRVYVPALLANAKALAAGESNWETEIDGSPWQQNTFPYQGKCLQWINQQYAALDDRQREQVNVILSGTGCEALLHYR